MQIGIAKASFICRFCKIKLNFKLNSEEFQTKKEDYLNEKFNKKQVIFALKFAGNQAL